jgi:uncharacterized protein (DUF1015 family)
MSPSPTVVPTPAGLVLAPFRGLRFDEAVAGPLSRLTAPPYDVIDEAGVASYEAMDPHNVVRLILPRDDADGGRDGYGVAAALLQQWRDAGVLRAEDEAALYVYEMRAGDHVQRGLLGALGLAAPDAGIVLPHESTMAGPVSDRLELTRATAANLEPIFLIYDGGGAASRLVAEVGARPPVAVATTEDGVAHRLWAVTEPDVLAEVAADLLPRRAVIADGHHRYANFLAYQAEQHAAGRGPGAWDFGLAFLVDATAFGPEVHAIHRVVPGLSAAEGARRADGAFAVTRLEASLPGSLPDALHALATAGKSGPAFLLVDEESCWLVEAPTTAALSVLPAERSAAWRELDVTVLHAVLVHSVWGLTDDETTVEYRHDVDAALAGARERGGCAVLLNPTPLSALAAVAATGERMPRKSTFFTPKPRTGMVIRAHDLG